MARDFKNGITVNGNAVGQLATSGTPADLGTAALGTSAEAARADHVHNSTVGGGSGPAILGTVQTVATNFDGTISLNSDAGIVIAPTQYTEPPLP